MGRLEATLNHIAGLNVPQGYTVELLLVDNASTDNTSSFAATIWDELRVPFSLRILKENRPGKGFAIETGYDAAKYSYILTVDDDNWLDKQYLSKAVELFTTYPDISVLQGCSEAVFEADPPSWFADPRMAKQLVVGGPIDEPGYFPEGHYHIWGAGLVIHQKSWLELRQRGFSFLTSKVPGKAAGEDSELGLGLSLLGQKFYYSPELKFEHFMPASRLTWEKLKQNFDTFGYVSYYFGLYAAVLEALRNGKQLNALSITKSVLGGLIKQLRLMTVKQHAAFWIKPQEEYYQLLLTEYYSRLKWLLKLSVRWQQDASIIEKWAGPLVLPKDN